MYKLIKELRIFPAIVSCLFALGTFMTGCGMQDGEKDYVEIFEGEMQEIEMRRANVPMELSDYNTYFSGKKENMSVIDISKISVVSGRLTAMDYSDADFASEDDTLLYTENIPNGEYDVKASVVDHGKGGHRIAAAKIEFTHESPVTFKMALYENQDISKLDDGQFYGFSVDSGFALIADARVLDEYCAVLKEFGEENENAEFPSIDYYETHLEGLLQDAYDKYPGYDLDFIDFTVPGTEHHITFLSSGYGDGTYPVYFGYSESGELCCAVVQFIFPMNL